MRKSLWVIPIALLFATIIGAPASHAGSITYKISDTASGRIGGTSFTDALVTIAFMGNTSNVHVSGGAGNFLNVLGTATVTISGIGTFSFTDPVGVDAFQGGNGVPPVAEMVDFSDATVIFGTANSAFAAYGLTTAIGPLTGNAFTDFDMYRTTDGLLIFSGAIGGDSTFTATTATTEPSSLLLFGTSLFGLVPFRRKLFGR